MSVCDNRIIRNNGNGAEDGIRISYLVDQRFYCGYVILARGGGVNELSRRFTLDIPILSGSPRQAAIWPAMMNINEGPVSYNLIDLGQSRAENARAAERPRIVVI